MRILTGQHRIEFEALLQGLARQTIKADLLQDRLDDWKRYIDKLHGDIQRERQRADNAVDALLAMRGVPPISPQLDVPPVSFENPLAEDSAEVERIEADMKRLGVGAVFAGEAKG